MRLFKIEAYNYWGRRHDNTEFVVKAKNKSQADGIAKMLLMPQWGTASCIRVTEIRGVQ